MRFLKILVEISVVTLLGSYAVAGAGAHGGQGVVCKDAHGNVTSVMLADHYEGENTLQGTKLDMGPTTGFYMDNVNYVLNRLALIDPVASDRYRKRALLFEQEWDLSTHALNIVDDAHEPLQVDPGCEMAQFAIQNFPVKPLQPKYIVDKAIWEGADVIARAGLVLHEVVYTDALTLGQTTSDNTRYYNYIISSTAINGMNADRYKEILGASGFMPGHSGDCLFSVFYDSLPVCVVGDKVTTLFGESPFLLANGQTVTVGPTQCNQSWGVCGVRFENENVSIAVLSKPTILNVGGLEINSDLIWLYPNRILKAMSTIADRSGIQIPTSVGTLTFIGGTTKLQFFQNGNFQMGYLSTPHSVVIGSKPFIISGDVYFDIKGNFSQAGKRVGEFSSLVNGQEVQFTAATFHDDGRIVYGIVPGGQDIRNTDGGIIHLKNGLSGRTKYYEIYYLYDNPKEKIEVVDTKDKDGTHLHAPWN